MAFPTVLLGIPIIILSWTYFSEAAEELKDIPTPSFLNNIIQSGYKKKKLMSIYLTANYFVFLPIKASCKKKMFMDAATKG